MSIRFLSGCKVIALSLSVLQGFIGYSQTGISGVQVEEQPATVFSYTALRAPDAAAASGKYTSPGNYNYHFGTGTNKILKAFTAGGAGYKYEQGNDIIVKLRRVENPAMITHRSAFGVPVSVPTPTPREIAYFEGKLSGTDLNLTATYKASMEELFVSNDISIGVDNLFNNLRVSGGTSNFNNVERIDVISSGGITILNADAQGVAVFERGAYNSHDESVIALITELDMNGDPAAYYPHLIRVKSTDYKYQGGAQNPYMPAAGNDFIILRKDYEEDYLRGSDIVTGQGVGGSFVKFSDFGALPEGTIVYGYSILSADFPETGTGAHVVDYTNTTYFPLNSDGATSTGYAGNDMAMITGVVKVLKISGNVYHDANGINNMLVDGSVTYAADGQQLYVNLVNADGMIVGVATVAEDGSFELNRMSFGDLTAQLSIHPGTIGTSAPAIELPGVWKHVGEDFGSNNFSGSGIDDMQDGIVNVKIGSDDIEGIRFGIEQAPENDDKYTNIPTPQPGDILVLNNSGINPMPVLSGEDAEDGMMGTGKPVRIYPADHGTLYYDGHVINEASGYLVTDFDPAKLSIVFDLPAGAPGYKNVMFNYSFIDAAGMDGALAAYTLSWESPLPVKLLYFNAIPDVNCSVLIEWGTAQDEGIVDYIVQRSTDGSSYSDIAALERYADFNRYEYMDNDLVNGQRFYRLKIRDHKGVDTYSEIVFLAKECNTELVSVYPNPAQKEDVVTIHIQGELMNANYIIYNYSGQVEQRGLLPGSMNRIDVSGIVPGVYIIQIRNGKDTYNRQLSLK